MAETNLQKSYIQSNLVKGEEVVEYSKRSLPWLIMKAVPLVIWILILAFREDLAIKVGEWTESFSAVDATYDILKWAGIAFIIIHGLGAILGVIRFLRCSMALTTRRVIARAGVLSTASQDAQLEKIDSVEVRQPLFGKIFGYATLVVKIAGGSMITMVGVEGADSYKNRIVTQIDVRKEELAKFQAEETARAMKAAMEAANAAK